MLFPDNLKARINAALAWAGDAAHRRALIGAILMLGNHLFGWTNDASVLVAVDTFLAFFLSAWSSRTPKLEPTGE